MGRVAALRAGAGGDLRDQHGRDLPADPMTTQVFFTVLALVVGIFLVWFVWPDNDN
jgi:hypothetical protein